MAPVGTRLMEESVGVILSVLNGETVAPMQRVYAAVCEHFQPFFMFNTGRQCSINICQKSSDIDRFSNKKWVLRICTDGNLQTSEMFKSLNLQTSEMFWFLPIFETF